MRVLWQAIRAATVETLGVALVIVVLFGLPAWTLTEQTSGFSHTESFKTWIESLRDGFQNRAAVAKPEVEARQRYAERRLSHYSQSFGNAASGCVKRVVKQVSHRPHG